MEINIRPYIQSDNKALFNIFKRNTPQYFDPKEIHDFQKYLEEKADTFLTVELSQNIVGGTGFEVNETKQTGSIIWIFFDPDHTGKGIGKSAVEYCLTALKKDQRVKRYVVRTSQLVFPFFEKFGFQTIRTEKDYWGEGLDLYLMEMDRDD